MSKNLTARPIRFTYDIPGWQRLIEALGGALISEHPGWLVYAVGSGRVALHAASDEQPPGAMLAFETSTPLAKAVTEAVAAGVPITLGHADHGEAGKVTAPDGTYFTLDSPTPLELPPALSTDPRLAALQLWYGPDTAMMRAVVQGLGAAPRLVGDDGTWTDLKCGTNGGLVGVHAAEESAVELAFEWDGNVEDALSLLQDAGIEALLIDETYSRTVQVRDPDGIKSIWINERQTDLYGYTQAS